MIMHCITIKIDNPLSTTHYSQLTTNYLTRSIKMNIKLKENEI